MTGESENVYKIAEEFKRKMEECPLKLFVVKVNIHVNSRASILF